MQCYIGDASEKDLTLLVKKNSCSAISATHSGARGAHTGACHPSSPASESPSIDIAQGDGETEREQEGGMSRCMKQDRVWEGGGVEGGP